MRIAEVAPYGVDPYSGVLTVLVRLSIELARRGHELEVWQLHDWPEPDTRALVGRLEDAGVRCVRIEGADSPWRLNARARETIAARSVDVVHLHNGFSPQNNVVAARLEVPYVVSTHGVYAPAVLRRRRWRKAFFLLVKDRPMLRRAAAIFALSEAERRDLARLGLRERVTVIPHGVDGPPSGIDSGAFRRSLGVPPDAKLAVFLGRLDIYYKRLDALVRGVAAAEAWNLALVGPDWLGSEIRLGALIQELGIQNRVFVAGTRRGPESWEVLAAADVFVLLSRTEGLAMALLEALASGVPVVVSPEVEEVTGVVERGAGWLAEPGCVADLLERLQGLSPDDWAVRRAAAFRFAEELSWGDVAARYEPVLEEAIGSGVPLK